MAHRRLVRSLLLGFCLTLFATSLFAQQGTISGRITRTNGSGIGGVIVQVVELSRVELSDSNGDFRFSVPPGTYTMSFVAGDQAATENNVAVTSSATTRVDKQVDWNLSVAETITVYSASRRTERVVDAPAAVTVMATEEIEAVAASGQAPRIIEGAPGVDFTQSGLYDTNFNARGFNSSLNRRILTLIDGRDPAIAFLGSQEWAALSLPIDEMASVELIRGPGSALYGANAFSGVLNMTTKQPRLTPGGRLMVSAGDLSTKRADIRHAGGFGGEWYYRVTGGYAQSDDFTRSRNVSVEYTVPCTATLSVNCLPREPGPLALTEDNIRFGGLRLDKHFANSSVFTVEGGYSTIEGPTFQTGIGRVQVTDVKRPWFRANFNTRHWNLSGYRDARKAERQVALASGSGLNPAATAPGTTGLWEDSSNLHAEVQTNWSFFEERTRVVGGVAWHKQEVDTADPFGFDTLMSTDTQETQKSAFGQVEFEVTQALKLVGAARWDDSTLHEAEFSPRAALVYNFAQNHTLRLGYSQAFQRPNYSELFLRVTAGAPVNLAAAAAANPNPQVQALAPALTFFGFNNMRVLARGNGALDVEKVKSKELGYSGIFGGKLFLTVDLYQSNMTNFVTDLLPGVNQAAFPTYAVPGTLGPVAQGGVTQFLAGALGGRRVGVSVVDGAPALVLSYANAGEVDTNGGEIAINYYLTNNWVLDFNYSKFDFDVKSQQLGDRLLPNAPENKYNLGVAWRGAKLDAKVSYRWVEEFEWAAGVFVGTIPEFDVVNISGNYRINNTFGLGVDISNAFDNVHYEAFGGDLLSRRALGFVTVNW